MCCDFSAHLSPSGQPLQKVATVAGGIPVYARSKEHYARCCLKMLALCARLEANDESSLGSAVDGRA